MISRKSFVEKVFLNPNEQNYICVGLNEKHHDTFFSVS